MSDSFASYMEDLREYIYLCELVGEEPYTDQYNGTEVDYDHFEELKKLPYVTWCNGRWTVDKENYPEYFV